jgi:hypothetical protein
MKHYVAVIAAFIFCFTINFDANAQNWIPYQEYQTQTVQVTNTYPVVFYPNPQPVIFYQWTPYMIQQATIIEHECWFRKTRKIVTVPTIQWFYAPTMIYK